MTMMVEVKSARLEERREDEMDFQVVAADNVLAFGQPA